MQKGFRDSEEAIYCDYGTLRPLRLKVAECTDYMDRTAPSRAEMEGMALLINISPARPECWIHPRACWFLAGRGRRGN
jgi:hypothetical protein